jgi:hypothetical protein
MLHRLRAALCVFRNGPRRRTLDKRTQIRQLDRTSSRTSCTGSLPIRSMPLLWSSHAAGRLPLRSP